MKEFEVIYFDSFHPIYINTLLKLLDDTSNCFFTFTPTLSVFPCKKNELKYSTIQIETAGLIEGLISGQ
jgi:hypothetical protein